MHAAAVVDHPQPQHRGRARGSLRQPAGASPARALEAGIAQHRGDVRPRPVDRQPRQQLPVEPGLDGGEAAAAELRGPAAQLQALRPGQGAALDEQVGLAAESESREVGAGLGHRHVEVLEVAQAAREAMQRGLSGGAGGLGQRPQRLQCFPKSAAHELLAHPGGAVVRPGERAALADLPKQQPRGGQLDAGLEQAAVVDAEGQHAPRREQAHQHPQPGDEPLFRQMGEQRGDEDGVEGPGARRGGEVLGAHRRDQAVDAETPLLEAHAGGVDVRHPDALRRQQAQQEAGDAAVAAGEVEQPADPPRLAEAPAQHLGHGAGDAGAGLEVGIERPLAVARARPHEEAQHLVLGIDLEVDGARFEAQVGEQQAHQGAGLGEARLRRHDGREV